MTNKSDTPKCELCGEPMQQGEEMFKYHGYSGPCPKPPLPQQKTDPDNPINGMSVSELLAHRRPRTSDGGYWHDDDSLVSIESFSELARRLKETQGELAALKAENERLNRELQKRDKCAFIGPMRDCPTHGDKARSTK